MPAKRKKRAPNLIPDPDTLLQHRAKRPCPHLAAEVQDPGLIEQLTYGLLPWAAQVAVSAGKPRTPRMQDPLRVRRVKRYRAPIERG